MKCSEWQNEIIKSDNEENNYKERNEKESHLKKCKSCKKFDESLKLASCLFGGDEISYNDDVYGKIKDKLDASLYKKRENNVINSKKGFKLDSNFKLLLTSAATVVVVISAMGIIYINNFFQTEDDSIVVNNKSGDSEILENYDSSEDDVVTENEAYETYEFNVFENLDKYGDIYYKGNGNYNISEELFGNVKLEMDTSDIKEILGNPDYFKEIASNNDSGNKYRVWRYKDDSVELQFGTQNGNSELLLNKIIASGLCSMKTKSGIGIGSSLAELIDAYRGRILKPYDGYKDKEVVAVGDFEKSVINFKIFNNKVIEIIYFNEYSVKED